MMNQKWKGVLLLMTSITSILVLQALQNDTWYIKSLPIASFQSSFLNSLHNKTSSQNKSHIFISDIVLKMLHVKENQSSIQANYQQFHQFAKRGEIRQCLGEGHNADMLNALGEILQNRIYHLQHPMDCKNARKMLVSVSHSGYGAQIHRLMLYFMYAYVKNRTVVFVDKRWEFSERGKNKWGDFHEPLSSSCNDPSGENVTNTKLMKEKMWDRYQVLECWDCFPHLNKYVLKSIPVDIASILIEYHKRPLHWWSGQFVKYIFKPKPWLMEHIERISAKYQHLHPIVGLQVRTTDKVLENDADFFPVKEYFKWSDNFFHSVHTSKMNVFLATDNQSVVDEAKGAFSGYYNIINEEAHAESASKFRYSKASLIGIIADVYLLSQTDYLVCTFSSNVCKLAYELMQAQGGDKSFCTHSLDSEYWLFKYCMQRKVVIEDNVLTHSSLDRELELKVGNYIEINVKGRQAPDGYSEGIVHSKGRHKGIYPLNKAIDSIFVYTPLNYSSFDLALL